MSIPNWQFWGLVVLTLIIIGSYQWGVKANLKLAKVWSEILETIFRPSDKEYTWLGGVIGFSADYQTRFFKKVKANLRLLPRQSLFYLPLSLLMGRRDSLQLVLRLPQPINQECHLVKKAFYGTFVPENSQLSKEKFKIQGRSFYVFAEKDSFKELENLVEDARYLKHLKHLALNKKHNVCFLEVSARLPEQARLLIEDIVKQIKKLSNV